MSEKSTTDAPPPMSKSRLSDAEFNDSDTVSMAERHAQHMADLARVGRNITRFVLLVITLCIGFTIFFLFKYHPFWKYP